MISLFYITDNYFPNQVYIGLQRKMLRINKVNGLVTTGTENPSTRPNHLDLGDENSKMQAKREIRQCDYCGGRCSICCTHKKNTPLTRELYYPSDGNMQKCNGNVNKILDGLPISLG